MKNFLVSLGCFLLALAPAIAQDRNLTKFEPTKDMVELKDVKNKIRLHVGQKAYTQYRLHSSVGIYGDVIVKDTTVLRIIDTQVAYDRPHQEGMTGDDNAVVTVVFEAIQKGKTEAIAEHKFRGQTQSKYNFKIIVK